MRLCSGDGCSDGCFDYYEDYYLHCLRIFQPFFAEDGLQNRTIRAIVAGCEARRGPQALIIACCR